MTLDELVFDRWGNDYDKPRATLAKLYRPKIDNSQLWIMRWEHEEGVYSLYHYRDEHDLGDRFRMLEPIAAQAIIYAFEKGEL